MPTKTFPIFENRKIHVPWNWSKNGAEVSKSITWTEGKTTVIGAKLRFTVDPNVGYTKAWVEFNYSEIARFHWALGEKSPQSEEFDVIGNLVNGSNHCKIVGAKEAGNTSDVVFYISVSVVLTYEGDDPDVEPDWMRYLKYGAYGVATAAGVVIVGKALKEEKK